ncbi:hypothetical protein DIPPA_29990 [Diplonema papillatum]|nr:hypothetical protein DIPPA_29990 [Diplonema papillatum]|eukprot:gene21711-33399_t
MGMWYQQSNGQGLPVMGVASFKGDDVSTLFEGAVPVSVCRDGKEPTTEVFNVGVMAGGNSPLVAVEACSVPRQQPPPPSSTGRIKRQVHLRITSPSDPFLLHTATIDEDEYPQFKEANGLRFDFVQFPSVLVNLLQERTLRDTDHRSPSHTSATPSPTRTVDTTLTDHPQDGILARSCRLFLADPSHDTPSPSASFTGQANASSNMAAAALIARQVSGHKKAASPAIGRFSFCQADKYRDSEVLGMSVKHEDDAGQKQYLAARAAKLDRELSTALKELEDARLQLRERSSFYETSQRALSRERDELSDTVKRLAVDMRSEADQREQELSRRHMEELRQAAEKQEARYDDYKSKTDERLALLEQELRKRTEAFNTLQQECSAETKTSAETRMQLTSTGADLEKTERQRKRLEAEVERLEKTVEDQHRELQEKSLKLVELSTKTQSLTESTTREAARSETMAASLANLQDDATSWRAQAAANAQKIDEKDSELKKSYHIIRTMHSKLQEHKNKREKLAGTAKSKDRDLSVYKEENASLKQELEQAKKDGAEAKEKLAKSVESAEAFKKELDEANACIEYHHRSTRPHHTYNLHGIPPVPRYNSAYSKSVGATTVLSTVGAGLHQKYDATHTALTKRSPASATPPKDDVSQVGGDDAATRVVEFKKIEIVDRTRLTNTPGDPEERTTSTGRGGTFQRASSVMTASPLPLSTDRKPQSSILTSSPHHVPGLVGSLSQTYTGESSFTRRSAAPFVPSNFFVSDVTGPVGTTTA